MVPKLHSVLNTTYGSCHRNLNSLTTVLRKCAISTAGLVYLLKCRRHKVFPAFVTRSVRFMQLGQHLQRLAGKLPLKMLRAAIRDMRARCTQLQWEIDSIWRDLYSVIIDSELWNALVWQKDSYYSSIYRTATVRLRGKFAALFTSCPTDPYLDVDKRSVSAQTALSLEIPRSSASNDLVCKLTFDMNTDQRLTDTGL